MDSTINSMDYLNVVVSGFAWEEPTDSDGDDMQPLKPLGGYIIGKIDKSRFSSLLVNKIFVDWVRYIAHGGAF